MSDKLEKLKKPLNKKDIELRVGTCSEKGYSILLYKTARVDMERLDEVFGLNWKNHHYVDNKSNIVCTIEVFDGEKWISREDTGSESMTEKEKGAYSDSFKRAGQRFGIGRELYKSPFMWVSGKVKKNNKNKYEPFPRLDYAEVTEYSVKDGVPQITIKVKDEVLFSNTKYSPKPKKQEIDYEDKITNCKNLDELKDVFMSMPKKDQQELVYLKDQKKAELTAK